MTADVVIIRGGVVGCSIAYHLARDRCRVVLFEREPQVGCRSTGRCSGGVRHQFSDPLNVKLSIASIRKLKDFEEDIGYPIDLCQDGYLFLLTREDESVDTTTPAGKMVFTVLGAVAELQRSLIGERVRAGLRNARAKGIRLGRRPIKVLSAAEIRSLRRDRRARMSYSALAKKYGTTVWTAYSSCKRHDGAPGLKPAG